MQRATLLLLLLLGLAAAPLRAQGPGGPQERPKNLKVFPKNIPRDSLLDAMRGFTQALGVRCTYCHATVKSSTGQDSTDFASDAKPEKNQARFMIRMVRDLNGRTLTRLPDRSDPPVRVTCTTCHRGSALPRTIDQVVAVAIDSAGVEAGIARYRQLRQQPMESGRYDFSETPVNELARRLAAGGKTAEAASILEMNAEFHPASAAIDAQLGDVYRQRGERDKAIARYRMALEKQPNNQMVRRRLQELTGEQPPR